ncbi:MAG TPA: hemolysin III family protein [Spirochaetota bacterium]|nr:hemolysin III family protein [Spirochaetota bacterium]HPJ36212.1 hemolysin III family protein [Spirochaetota bacterium]
MKIPKSEKISAYTHGGAIPVMAAGTAILMYMSRGNLHLQIVSLIYGLSAVMLFTASFLYHCRKSGENDTSVWRKLDHSAIFLLIAGTYTPMCYLYLDGWMRWGILIAQWSLVFSGIIFKLFFINAPRIIGTAIYLIMGWIVVIPIARLVNTMPGDAMFFLVAGGIAYTVGGIIYMIKKPNPIPNRFGFHEIFHIFIIAGAVFHLFMVIVGIDKFSGLM